LLHGSYSGQGNTLELTNDIDSAIGNGLGIQENRVAAAVVRKMPHVLSVSRVLTEEHGYAAGNQAIKDAFTCGTVTSGLQAKHRLEKGLGKKVRASLTVDDVAAEKRAVARRIGTLGHQLPS
jgi:hypothetical protein